MHHEFPHLNQHHDKQSLAPVQIGSRQKNHIVQLGPVSIGGPEFVIIAGPCSIESPEQFQKTAEFVKTQGAQVVRGGIFKLRTNPTSFQGLGNTAYNFIREIKSHLQIPLVSEVTDPRQISDLADVVDMFQVGSRNMYNYALLRELGQLRKPVMLKRGFSATVEEWLLAAEYLVQGGNDQIVLCERGIRTFETTTRNTLDLNSVAYIKEHTSWPVIVDPSHGTGRPELIGRLSLAAAAVGADGIIVEVHPEPEKALSDAFQALSFTEFSKIVLNLKKVLQALTY